MSFKHSSPKWAYHITRNYSGKMTGNGVTNGQPYTLTWRAAKHSTKIYPSPSPSCLLPAAEWGRDAEGDFKIVTHLTYEHRSPSKLQGQQLYGKSTDIHSTLQSLKPQADVFDRTPKIHSGVELYEEGQFNYFIGLDTLTVFESLRCKEISFTSRGHPDETRTGKGKADVPRDQRYVRITGCFDMEKYPTDDKATVICTCLLAPEQHRHLSRKLSFCETDCPITITSREYVNCREVEVLGEMLDFQRLDYRPRVETFFLPPIPPRVTVQESRERTFMSYY